jgi:DNA-binding transcriptional LysR family regulator
LFLSFKIKKIYQMVSAMRLKNLETFYWVATIGSFRQTAERLHATQPAISARIAGLERDLGVTLFERQARRVVLTQEGHETLRYAEKILALSGELTANVGAQDHIAGVVRIGASETLVHTWFPELLVALSDSYPRLSVEAHVDITPNLREELVRRELDLAFLTGPVSEPSMVNRPICGYPMVWVAKPDYPLPPGRLRKADVAGEPIITFPRRTRPTANLVNSLAAPDLPPLRLSSASSLTAIFHLAEQGFGLAVVPQSVVADRIAAGRLRQLDVDVDLEDLDFTATYSPQPAGRVVEAIVDKALDLTARLCTAPPPER